MGRQERSDKVHPGDQACTCQGSKQRLCALKNWGGGGVGGLAGLKRMGGRSLSADLSGSEVCSGIENIPVWLGGKTRMRLKSVHIRGWRSQN